MEIFKYKSILLNKYSFIFYNLLFQLIFILIYINIDIHKIKNHEI